MTHLAAAPELIAVIVRLRQALVDNPLPTEAPGAAAVRLERDQLMNQLDDYILPRLVQLEAPLLAVVGGSTGAGKSTLVNTLIGKHVTQSGVLRPTTRSPVLVHHPDDVHWFGADRLLPELTRTTSPAHDQDTLQLVATDGLPAGIAIIDAPDVDSVEERNRTLAAQLLAAADLWLFVTSAARYADQVPWQSLKSAAERGAAVAMVLDRTTPVAVREVSGHLSRMLSSRGLGDARLFTVPQTEVDKVGLLPDQAVQPIREWLASLAADSAARSRVIRKTLDGTVASLGHRTRSIAEALRTQEQSNAQLRAQVQQLYADHLETTLAACRQGSLLQGQLWALWQDFERSGELMRGVEDKTGRLRDRLVDTARHHRQPVGRLEAGVEQQLAAFLVERVRAAAEQVEAQWRQTDAGPALLGLMPGDSESAPSGRDAAVANLARPSADIEERARDAVARWLATVLESVRAEGSDRQATSRFLRYGVQSLAVALAVSALDLERALAGQSRVATARRVLGGVFGSQTFERLANTAADNLGSQIQELWRDEERKFFEVLEQTHVGEGAAERLVTLSREVDDTRWAVTGA
ncbi:MAG: GTPase domain-containing protein [Nocardioidaceae bacterium]